MHDFRQTQLIPYPNIYLSKPPAAAAWLLLFPEIHSQLQWILNEVHLSNMALRVSTLVCYNTADWASDSPLRSFGTTLEVAAEVCQEPRARKPQGGNS